MCCLIAFFFQSAKPYQNKSNAIDWGENEQTSVTKEQKNKRRWRKDGGDKRESETGGRMRNMKVRSEIAEEMGAGMSFPAVFIL